MVIPVKEKSCSFRFLKLHQFCFSYLFVITLLLDGSFYACEDSFLSRLLQTGATESSSAVNNVTQTEDEHKQMDDEKMMKILQNIVATVDDIWQMKDKLCAAVLKVLPEDGKKFSNVFSFH